MKILALDSSGLVASVALLENDNLVAEFTVNNKKTHSQTLLPMLDEVVKAAGIELDTVDAIAIAAGPGSFTGLRIGAATVKGLSLALDKPIIPVPTLEGLHIISGEVTDLSVRSWMPEGIRSIPDCTDLINQAIWLQRWSRYRWM